MSGGAQWLPLESNPEVIEAYLRRLGLPETACFHDVYGLEPDLLAMVRQTPKIFDSLFV